MYFSNAVIDSVTVKLPELFNCLKSEKAAFAKLTKLDEDLNDEPYPVEPVNWPNGAAVSSIAAHRGNGAMALVHGGGDGLVVKLNVGSSYESFMERSYIQTSMAVGSQSETVLNDLRARSLWPNISDNVRAPKLGKGTEADLMKFVEAGKHVEGVAARLVALGLEHALVPFTQRTRVRNAAACYWCTGKYRSDGIIYSVQNTQGILGWADPNGVGRDNDPTVAIWVDSARKPMGMSLLSRIMDQGGPIMMQDSYLLKQFDPGNLLMVGTGELVRDFRAIQPEDLMDAIDEALWILVTYNNLPAQFIRNSLRLLIRNLPVVDMAHYREVSPLYWRTRSARVGDPDLAGGIQELVDEAIARAFPAEARDAVGLDDDGLARGFFSDLMRRQALAPGVGLAGFAPHIDAQVRWEVCGFLAALQRPTIGQIDGQDVHFAALDVGAPPGVPNVAPFTRAAMDGVMACFSGRAGFRIYAYSGAADVLGNIVVPDGWQDLGVWVPPGIAHPDGVARDGHWLTWVGGNNAAGDPHIMAGGLRHYVVRSWIPTTHEHYMGGYVAPPAAMRRYDVDANFRMGVRPGGALPDLNDAMPRVSAYMRGVDTAGTPLDLIAEEGHRNLADLTAGQRALALMHGLAYAWDAFALGRTQNDAYGRWVVANHAGRHLTTIPDELMLYLGGVRSRRYVEPNGGLWTLCFQKIPKEVKARAGHEAELSILFDRNRLASYILKFRCAVDMADQLLRVSNARIGGCLEPFLWPQAVDDRLARARVLEETVMDGATYLARQALVMSTVFDHPDAVVARTFNVTACSTMRLREPRVRIGFNQSRVKHCNWLSPQILKTAAWAWYYGIAAPSFMPDRQGQSWLRDARYTSEWKGVHEDLEAGSMIHRSDEIWSAVLTAYCNTDWYPCALEVCNFGQVLRVDVSDVRARMAVGYTQPMMRLNLPYETRLAMVTVHGYDLDAEMKLELNCPQVREVDDGDDLYPSQFDYDGRGRLTQVVLDPAAVDFENLDLRDTTFGSAGIDFLHVPTVTVYNDFGDMEKSSGQYWMSRSVPVDKVSAGMSAGLQRLLEMLLPPPIVKEEDDGHGKEVRGAGRIEVEIPDMGSAAPVGEDGVGDVPLVEVGPSSAASILSSLSGASPEVLDLIRNALLKDKMGDTSSSVTPATAESTHEGET